MRIITPPEPCIYKYKEVPLFLAGGIQKCSEWQKEVISELEKRNLEKLVVLNPKRENFPIGNPNAAEEQIKWEYYALNTCDIFTMYFDESESDQPICMYELGRHLVLMREKYPFSWQDRIIITSNPKYKRYLDVLIQTGLATNDRIKINTSLEEHIEAIASSYIKAKECNK